MSVLHVGLWLLALGCRPRWTRPSPATSLPVPQGSAQTSRMPVPASSKHRPGALDKALDKAGKPKLQDPRQYRQVVLP